MIVLCCGKLDFNLLAFGVVSRGLQLEPPMAGARCLHAKAGPMTILLGLAHAHIPSDLSPAGAHSKAIPMTSHTTRFAGVTLVQRGGLLVSAGARRR